MNKTIGRFLTAVAACSLGLSALAAETPTLEQGFINPPASARPWVYWYFMDGNLTREGITADLEAMKAAGIGGAIFLEVNVGIPRGPVDFMSAPWQELFKHIVHEADRLGIEITLNAGPGWTGSGGPWVKPEQSMQHIVAAETNIAGPMRFDAVLPRPQPRKPFFGEGALPPPIEKARKEWFADVVVLAFPTPKDPQRIADIDEKALYVRAPFSSQPGVRPFLPAPAEFPSAKPEACIAPDKIINLTDKLSSDGHLAWDVPEGDWTILRFARTATGQNTRPAPTPGLGLECDKFDKAALDAHFDAFVNTLVKAVGPRQSQGLGWNMLHIDSWEMSAQNWTPKFREEFLRRRGYDLLPFLPAMTGRIVESLEKSERFLWDVRQTAQELVVENHALHLKELGRKHGFGLSIEPYDMNPCADFNLGSAADVPMCEFWARGYGFNTDFSCFESTSIAHTLGRPIVGAESFTSGAEERWLLHPGAMKNQGDWAFCTGINRFVFHRFQHQPWLDRWPGMTMGPYGVHWERTQTWWDMVQAYHQYLSRCQFMLRRGVSVADICYLVPEGAPQVFRPPKSALRGDPPDRLGYNFDGCAPETLLKFMSVKDHKLVLPGGASYRVLVLPALDTMTPGLLQKIKELVQDGATIIGAPPAKSPSLANYPKCDEDIKALVAELWGNGRNTGTIDRHVGKGRVVQPAEMAHSPEPAGRKPIASAKWIWHAEGQPAASAPVGTRCFRKTFVLKTNNPIESATLQMSADNSFEAWVNGQSVLNGSSFHETSSADVLRVLKPGTNVLAVAAINAGENPNPAGLIGVLTIAFQGGSAMTISTDRGWKSAIEAGNEWLTSVVTPKGWKAVIELGAFEMAPWNRAQPSVIPDIYPDYRVTAELLAKMGVAPDLESDVPLRYIHRLEGPTHIYFVSNPSSQSVTTRAVFRVSNLQPELWDAVTGERRNLSEFTFDQQRMTVPMRFAPFQSFFFVFRKLAPKPPRVGRNFAELAVLSDIRGPWEVQFQANRGAPEKAIFDTLLDWSKHPDSGIQHFSGVATYRTQFDWKPENASQPKVFLDLGKAQVMAQVKLNGRDLGVVWTAPFHVPVTEVLNPGTNTLEIRVANLWPNRLIADAALPQEKRLTWTTWNPFAKDTPLLESGLLGPVELQAER